MEIQTEKGLQEALAIIAQGNFAKATAMLGKLFENDLESGEIFFTARCCKFWGEVTSRLVSMDTPYERGETLLSEWKNFMSFTSKEKTPYRPAINTVQRGVFSLALKNYSKLFEERDKSMRTNAYWKAGVCYKKLGQFDTAQSCLVEANSIQGDKAPMIAELADCYCLCGDDRPGKLLFREAFFLDPLRIELDFLDSELIRCLVEKTAEKGYAGQLLQSWIPVYGVLWGIFNIKRELRSQEVIKLRQDIYSLENELKEPGTEHAILMPRLINLYFWLIDYYGLTNDNSKKINEVLLKIKLLDSAIYDLYVK